MIDINMTILAQILNFLILLFILKKFAFGPLMKMLEEREQKIKKSIEFAEETEVKSQQMLKEYQAQLNEARTQAQEIVDKAMKVAAEERDASLAEARAEIERMRKNAQEQIVQEREAAIAQLKGEVVALSVAAATKIIGSNLDEAANEKLVGEFIQKMDKEKIGGLPC